MDQNETNLADSTADNDNNYENITEPTSYKRGVWTTEIEELLRQYIKEERHIDDITASINSIFVGVDLTKEAVIIKRADLIQKERPENAVIEYLSMGRTVREIANHFKLSLNEGKELINTNFDGWEIWPTRDENGEVRYILLPELNTTIKIQPRIWKFQLQPEGQPWIWIRFPETEWDQIRIVPLSDAHFGAQAHLLDKFIRYIHWIRDTPNAFTFINGDLIENALRDSIAGAIYESKIMPRQQIRYMTELLSQIAHKILWAIPGNHEDRSRKHVGFDPIEWICEKLNIPFFNDAVNATIWWGDHKWEFYAKHGNTNSATKGGKINAATKSLHDTEHIHFNIMGHVHDATVNRIDKHIRNFRTFRMEMKPQYVIICGSFYGYWGTYASKAGMSPASEGMPTCKLFPNGDYRADIR